MATCPECQQTFGDGVESCPEHGVVLLPDEAFATLDPPLAPGDRVGEYEVTKVLGSGTFGDVYAGEHPLIGKRVAIKVLARRFASDPQVVSRFIAEARAVNRIRHHHIIDIFAFGQLEGRGQHYFVMEHLDGQTLKEVMLDRGAMPLVEALPLLEAIGEALDAAHAEGITHRDLKPDNVFVADQKGRPFPKLLDFGVAKLAADEVAHRTATGMALGTPKYMSPEQARGKKKVGAPADIYAFGVLTFEMLTGRTPFVAESAVDMMFMHVSDPPPKPSSVSALPAALDAPILTMLDKSPSKRPATCAEALAAIVSAAEPLGLLERLLEGLLEAGGEASTVREPAAEAPTRRTPENEVSASESALHEEDVASAATLPSDERDAIDAPSGPATQVSPQVDADVTELAAAPPDFGVDATEIGQPTLVEAQAASSPGGSQGRLAAGLVVAAVAIGGGVWWASRGAEPDPPPIPIAPVASASASTAPSPMVEVRFDVEPDDAEVSLDGARLGRVDEPLSFPRSTVAKQLRIERDGYVPHLVTVVPDRDQTVARVILAREEKAAPTASSPAPLPGAKATVDPAIERPEDY